MTAALPSAGWEIRGIYFPAADLPKEKNATEWLSFRNKFAFSPPWLIKQPEGRGWNISKPQSHNCFNSKVPQWPIWSFPFHFFKPSRFHHGSATAGWYTLTRCLVLKRSQDCSFTQKSPSVSLSPAPFISTLPSHAGTELVMEWNGFGVLHQQEGHSEDGLLRTAVGFHTSHSIKRPSEYIPNHFSHFLPSFSSWLCWLSLWPYHPHF